MIRESAARTGGNSARKRTREIRRADAAHIVRITVDPVYISEADDGELIWNNRKFAPVDYDLWIAERGKVNDADATPEPEAAQ